MVSPRKSRKKSACFSKTITGTPAPASREPAIIPAGPPPAITHRVCSSTTDYTDSTDAHFLNALVMSSEVETSRELSCKLSFLDPARNDVCQMHSVVFHLCHPCNPWLLQ